MADGTAIRGPVRVAVEVLPHGRGIELPSFQTAGSAGADVRAAVEAPLAIEPGRAALVPAGIKIAIPPGYEVQVRPRSGLAIKNRILVPNSPGTIDSDYRGEVKVILLNAGDETFIVNRGDRIAQMVLARVERLEWDLVESVDATQRGAGGFGHTGV